MKKVLKQWGKSLGIYFDAEDIKLFLALPHLTLLNLSLQRLSTQKLTTP